MEPDRLKENMEPDNRPKEVDDRPKEKMERDMECDTHNEGIFSPRGSSRLPLD